MADTTGYYLFGGGVDDYARAYGSDTLLPNTALTISDPSTSGTLTDLLDGTANPDPTIQTDAHGEFKFWARLPVVNVTPAGGGTYQVISKSALVAAAAGGATSAQVSQAVAAANSAANAATAAANSAAASIPIAAKGVPSGVATLDTSGHLVTGQESQNSLDRLDQLEASIEGATAGVRDHQVFLFDATASPPSLAAGVPGGTWVAPGVDTVLDQVFMELSDYSTSVASTFDVQVNPPPYAGFVSCFTGALPTVPTTAKSAFGLAAPNPSVPARSLVRVVPTIVAPIGSGSGTPAALKGTQGQYNTGAGTASSHAITLPSGGAAGDSVIVAFTCPASATASMPVGWTKILDVTEPGINNRIRLCIFVAPWANTLVPTVTTSSGTNGVGWIRLVSGSDSTLMAAVSTSGYQSGASFAGPTGNAPFAADVLIEVAASDIPNPLTATTGYTWTGGPAGLTKDSDQVTTRTTVRNGSMSVGHANGVASGASVNADTFTLGGAASNTSWATARIFIPRGAGTHGPAKARVQVDLVSA